MESVENQIDRLARRIAEIGEAVEILQQTNEQRQLSIAHAQAAIIRAENQIERLTVERRQLAIQVEDLRAGLEVSNEL